MARCTFEAGIEQKTGKLKKNSPYTLRRKHYKDPFGNVVATGPNEEYYQSDRDYSQHPLTPAETRQRQRWTEVCRLASEIEHDTLHPRFREMYEGYLRQLKESEKPITQFGNYIRHVLQTQ